MRNCFKLFVILLCILCFCSCKKNAEDLYSDIIVEYLPYSPTKIEKMDSYTHIDYYDDTVYKSIYYFEDGKSVALKKEITFPTKNKAKKFYNKKVEGIDAFYLKLYNNAVTYYERYEKYDSYQCTKEEIIDLINYTDDDVE